MLLVKLHHRERSLRLDKEGKPKELSKYIKNSRYLVKYSKFDNFYERTEKKYEVKKFRWVIFADGTNAKILLSRQNIEKQERNFDREFKQKYGIRLKKYKVQEELSNERLEEHKDQNMNNYNEDLEESKSQIENLNIMTKKRTKRSRRRRKILMNRHWRIIYNYQTMKEKTRMKSTKDL